MVMPPSTHQQAQATILARVDEIVKDRSKTTEPITLSAPIQVLDYSDMVIGKELGTGSFSCAYEIKRIGNGQKPLANFERQYIMKKLSRKVTSNPLLFVACAADLQQEGRILASVNHPNIIQLRGWSGPDMIDDYFQKNDRDKCYLIMDRLDQNLDKKLQEWKDNKPSVWNFVSKRRQLEQDLRNEKLTNIFHFARGLEHLHQHNILHRDLKPGNIGLDGEGTLKIFDFDLARVLPKSDDKDATFQLTAKVGSPRYMAPEIIDGEYYNLKADVFSFGIITYQILTGKTPWKGLDYDWSKGNNKIPKSWRSDTRLVLQRCLLPNHKDRPTMALCVKELETIVTSTNNDDETIDSDPYGLGGICAVGMCGVALDDFNEILGCATAAPEEMFEDTRKSNRQ